jgi:hypothetical protein
VVAGQTIALDGYSLDQPGWELPCAVVGPLMVAPDVIGEFFDVRAPHYRVSKAPAC